MGKVMSLMMRPVKRYNIESRAHKVISRDKPVPAPQHDSTKKQIEAAQAMNPSFMETHNKKDSELDERLKNIYVQSHDPQVAEIEPDPNRVLPTIKEKAPEFEYGFWEPENTREGKCSLKSAVTFMSDYAEDPIKNSIEAIAAKYKLDHKHVANVLEYYRVYKVIIPYGDRTLAHVERGKIFTVTRGMEEVEDGQFKLKPK